MFTTTTDEHDIETDGYSLFARTRNEESHKRQEVVKNSIADVRELYAEHKPVLIDADRLIALLERFIDEKDEDGVTILSLYTAGTEKPILIESPDGMRLGTLAACFVGKT